jgi:heavy metal sensor kinase
VLTLRWRLTLWNVSLLTAALVAFTAVVLWAQWRLQVTRTDDTLARLRLTASNIIVEELEEHLPLDAAAREADEVASSTGHVVLIFSADKRLLTRAPGSLDIDALLARTGPGAKTVRGGDGSLWRVSLEPARLGKESLLIGVAVTLDEERRQWQELAGVTIVGLFLVLSIAGAGGWLLGRHGLRPLTSMAVHARGITPGTPDARLPVPATGDELTLVGDSFNRVLDRLGTALAQQRGFMADASHELRTPVSTMRTVIDVTLSRPDRDAAEYREALETMLQQTARLARLVDDMLVLARADSGGYQAVFADIDLGDLASECVRDLLVLANARNIALKNTVPRGTFIRGDDALLRRLLINLLSNAIAYTPENGAISVSAHIDGDFCELHVSDSGSGIPPEDRERIFSRFVRLNPAREAGGSGLGLAIARWIAEMHGGTLRVAESGPQGTTFTARLLHGEDALA